MIAKEEVKADMPVICANGGQFAVVDHLGEGGNSVKLKKDAHGSHHYMPLGWLTSAAEGKLHIDRPGEQAMKEWSTEPM